jgi:hypothetical protein
MSETDKQTDRKKGNMLSVTALKMLGKKAGDVYIMKEQLKRVNYCLSCGRPINLNLYTTPAFLLNCYASTYNCIINHLKIGLSLYRKKPIRLCGKFHKQGNDNVKRLCYIAVQRRVPYLKSIQSEQIASKNNTKYKNVRILNE